MPMRFSETLRKRAAKYFAERHNIELTDPQIEEFLVSLAGLYGCVVEGGAGARERAATPDLIYPHSCKRED